MSNKAKDTKLKLIKQHLQNIENGDINKELLSNPNFLTEYENDILVLNKDLLNNLICQFKEISPFVSNLKNEDITERNISNAVYLLFSSVIASFESTFILAENNKYSSIMILSRNIEEALKQIQLFMLEHRDNEDTKLQNWFDWEIISHWEWREKVSSSIDIDWLNIKEMSSYIYQLTSLFAHNWYISILENISPFTKDVDYSWLTEKYRLSWWIEQLLRNMTKCIVALKWVYFLILKDSKTYDEIDKILLKYNPNISDLSNIENIKKQFPKK